MRYASGQTVEQFDVVVRSGDADAPFGVVDEILPPGSEAARALGEPEGLLRLRWFRRKELFTATRILELGPRLFVCRDPERHSVRTLNEDCCATQTRLRYPSGEQVEVDDVVFEPRWRAEDFGFVVNVYDPGSADAVALGCPEGLVDIDWQQYGSITISSEQLLATWNYYYFVCRRRSDWLDKAGGPFQPTSTT